MIIWKYSLLAALSLLEGGGINAISSTDSGAALPSVDDGIEFGVAKARGNGSLRGPNNAHAETIAVSDAISLESDSKVNLVNGVAEDQGMIPKKENPIPVNLEDVTTDLSAKDSLEDHQVDLPTDNRTTIIPTDAPTTNPPITTPFPTRVIDPTPKPTSSCTGNTPDWVDVDGYGCEWWEVNDLPGCPIFGDEFEGTMGVANDNCCYCAGTAAPVIRPPPTPFPSYPPTVTRSPTTPFPTYPPFPSYPPTVTRSPTTPLPTYPPTATQPTRSPVIPCTGNTPGWVDSVGDGCEWYEFYDSPGCRFFGDEYEGTMGVANDNCCYCTGTSAPVITPSPTPFQSYTPTVTRSPTAPIPTM